jgi:selenium metabolism protein YedF
MYMSDLNANAPAYVVAFLKNRLGEGDEGLGQILIKAFINNLADNPERPEALVFLNSGIFLAQQDSPVLPALQRLEAAGVKLLSCGTCLDFYQKKESLGAGKVSNMVEITETLIRTGHVLYP